MFGHQSALNTGAQSGFGQQQTATFSQPQNTFGSQQNQGVRSSFSGQPQAQSFGGTISTFGQQPASQFGSSTFGQSQAPAFGAQNQNTFGGAFGNTMHVTNIGGVQQSQDAGFMPTAGTFSNLGQQTTPRVMQNQSFGQTSGTFGGFGNQTLQMQGNSATPYPLIVRNGSAAPNRVFAVSFFDNKNCYIFSAKDTTIVTKGSIMTPTVQPQQTDMGSTILCIDTPLSGKYQGFSFVGTNKGLYKVNNNTFFPEKLTNYDSIVPKVKVFGNYVVFSQLVFLNGAPKKVSDGGSSSGGPNRASQYSGSGYGFSSGAYGASQYGGASAAASGDTPYLYQLQILDDRQAVQWTSKEYACGGQFDVVDGNSQSVNSSSQPHLVIPVTDDPRHFYLFRIRSNSTSYSYNAQNSGLTLNEDSSDRSAIGQIRTSAIDAAISMCVYDKQNATVYIGTETGGIHSFNMRNKQGTTHPTSPTRVSGGLYDTKTSSYLFCCGSDIICKASDYAYYTVMSFQGYEVTAMAIKDDLCLVGLSSTQNASANEIHVYRISYKDETNGYNKMVTYLSKTKR